MRCGSCQDGMAELRLQTHIGTDVTIDVCWPCHMIWFDHLESTSLSPGSVIELFRQIHATRNEPRKLVAMRMACPICATTLAPASDLNKNGRFTYQRCSNGHGRLISFSQFLREKNFVRTLQPREIAGLAVKVRQIRCSSCGGPVDLVNDSACTHCGSPISVLDEAAVEKALTALDAKASERTSRDPERVGDALMAAERAAQRARRANAGSPSWSSVPVASGIADLSELVDLVEVGIGAALSAWLD